MNINTDHKSVCSVTEIAARLGLSRARFYQLQKTGIFPAPVYCTHTKRPFYPMDLQEKCLEIRKTGIGQNGHPIIFYSKRNGSSAKLLDVSENKYKEISEALGGMGLKMAPGKIKKAVKLLHPDNWHHLNVDGDLIAELFRYFQHGV
jgi:hypothetical protein